MSIGKRSLLSFGLSVIFVSSSFFAMVPNTIGWPAWVSHDPILIDGNADFVSANGVTGGSGTSSDPYIIEVWKILNSTGPAVEIRNTDAHLVIKNMYIWNVYDGVYGAIKITNASNIEIADSFIGTWVRILGVDPYGPVLYLENASHVMFRDPWNLNGGGVQAVDSDNVTVQGSAFMAMSYDGIHLSRCDNVTVASNRIDVGDMYEVWMTDCRNVLVTNNDLGKNECGYGFHINSSVNISVHSNNIFQWNSLYDDHTVTTNCPDELHLDDGYPAGGNYWELYSGVDLKSGPGQNQPNPDGIGDTPFAIGDDTDNFPLMEPVIWYTPVVMGIGANFDPPPYKVGQQLNLTAFMTDQYGNAVFGEEVSWYLDSSFASLEVNETNSSRAVLTAEMEGLIRLTVESGSAFGMHLLEIGLGLTAMDIAPVNQVVNFGDTIDFTTIGENEYTSLEGFWAEWSADWDYFGVDGLYTANTFNYSHISADGVIEPCVYTIRALRDGFIAATNLTVILSNATDHDSDGILDWLEIINGLDPFNASDLVDDMDHDGMTNAQEVEIGSKPYSGDSDGDGLWDTFEVIFSKTSPILRDTDGDGVEDETEFEKTNKYSADIVLTSGGWTNMNITWKDLWMYVDTNSSVIAAVFDVGGESLLLALTGDEGSTGALDIRIPRAACDKEDIQVMLDGSVVELIPGQDADYYYVHLEYSHSWHEIYVSFGEDESILGNVWLYIGIAGAVLVTALLLILRRRTRT